MWHGLSNKQSLPQENHSSVMNERWAWRTVLSIESRKSFVAAISFVQICTVVGINDFVILSTTTQKNKVNTDSWPVYEGDLLSTLAAMKYAGMKASWARLMGLTSKISNLARFFTDPRTKWRATLASALGILNPCFSTCFTSSCALIRRNTIQITVKNKTSDSDDNIARNIET